MLLISWLLVCLGIALPVLQLLAVFPWFITAVLLASLSKTKYNHMHIAVMGLIQVSWFGFLTDIITITMLGMLLAYYSQLAKGVYAWPFVLTAVLFTIIELILQIGPINFSINVGLILGVTFLTRLLLCLVVINYFIKKTKVLYA